MAEPNGSERTSMGDVYCTVSPVRIAEWLRAAPKQSAQLEVVAHEIESDCKLWLSTFDQLNEEYTTSESLLDLATFLRSQCEQHAQGQQAECRYSILCVDSNMATIGTCRLRVIPRSQTTQRLTGSTESLIVQLQRHNEALTRKLVEGTDTQFKAMQQVIEMQSRVIERLGQAEVARHEERQSLADLQATLEAEQLDAETQKKMWDVAQQLLPMILPNTPSTG